MSEKRPNLIYIFADQLRYASLGCNGDTKAHTPCIDELSRNCTNMDNAVSGHPVCAPYRASLLTGKYTTSTGMVINEIRLNPNHESFAHKLANSGYEAEYIGKWHMYAAQLGHHFDTKNSFIPKGPDRLGFDGYFAAYNFHHEYYAPKAYYHLDTHEKIYCEGYEPDCQTDMAIDRLTRLSAGNKPFALFLSLGTPHDPWVKENVPAEYYNMFADVSFDYPPNYVAKNDKYADMWARFHPGERKQLPEWMRVYYAMVANLDMNIGRLMAKIGELGLFDNSIVVFTSDHGELFGAHGRRAKNIFYDEAVRVPFYLRYDGVLPKGKNDISFNTVDIMPTLLSLMGIDSPAAVEGKDRSSLLLNGGSTDEGALMMGTGPTAIYGDGREWRAYRTKTHTYAVYRKDGKELLFDNIADPYQMNNLIGKKEYTGLAQSMKNAMYAEMERIGDNFEKNSYYKKHWVKDRIILPELN